MISKQYIEDFYSHLDRDCSLDKEGIAKLKIRLCKDHAIKKIPTDIQLLLSSTPEQVKKYRKRLQTKPNRSLSGVAPVAIMTSPWNCPHGKCTMCPGGIKSPWGDMPQSYTGKEPSTMRGIRANWDPYLMVFNRLEQYIVTGHVADKVDLIIMGGTFSARPNRYQQEFVAYSFKAMNDFSDLFFNGEEIDLEKFKKFFELPGEVGNNERTKRIHQKLFDLKGEANLKKEQLRNETAHIRCIGMTIETKPDWAFLEHGNRMLEQGCTRVELGVQGMHDELLDAIHRGHSVADNIKSIQILKDLGFKLNYHMMIGLPTLGGYRDDGTPIAGPKITSQQDIQDLKQLFDDANYRPDMLKIYPCMVMPGTELLVDYEEGRYEPLSTKEAAEIISEVMPHVQPYCRLMRVQRDIPTYRTTAGVDRTNLRQYVDILMKEKGYQSRDIRSRESGRKEIKHKVDVQLQVLEYEASGGIEFFISFEDVANDILYGFIRLRFPKEQLREEITPSTAIIRELHVYGSAVAIGSEDSNSSQHKGYGKQLLAKAEEIAKKRGYTDMIVISGVGVREYYRKFGYESRGPYVGKKLV